MKPEIYTLGHHGSVLASHGVRTAVNSAAYLLPHLRPGMRLLDIGCGPGTITLDLAAILGDGEVVGQVVGVENVEPPLVAAREAAALREDVHTRFELADVYRLPYDDDSFDVVHAHQVLQHLVDPVAALREMSRVCRSGGLIAVRDVDYEAMTWFPASEGMTAWHSIYRALARGNDAEPDAGRHLKAWARAAGLDDFTSSASLWCYSTAEECGWWSEAWMARATESSFADQTIEHGLADREMLNDISAAWEGWGQHPDAWFAMLHGEILATVR